MRLSNCSLDTLQEGVGRLTDDMLEAMYPLCRDFETFMDYVGRSEVAVSKKNQWLSRRVLYELNGLVSRPEPGATPNKDQISYPLLHLLYHLGRAGRLLQVEAHKANRWILKPTERYEQYQQLSLVEQYIFLLETFWVDVNWSDMVRDTRMWELPPLDSTFRVLLRLPSDRVSRLAADDDGDDNTERIRYLLWYMGEFVDYFAAFGFWTFEEDKEEGRYKGRIAVAAITPTPLFKKIGPVLLQERPLQLWNSAMRREFGGWAERPRRLVRKVPEVKSSPFYEPFVRLFPNGELQRSLPREPRGFQNGIYVFQVSLSRSCWRTIAVSARHTVEDLHRAIQRAYRFGDDHLYSFFLDGKKWSSQSVNSPYSDQGPYANEVLIGELNLLLGQRILYLFDYGDEWTFDVLLREIRPGGDLVKPEIIETRGEAPDQYTYWE
ncbi:IS1096 element passenger TnpR family protein [Kyrpidia tusciae]|uniref:Plasmid pRiA4b ORF-3 family protein n=1 Tax=Kyrpidia tusciae (strain DSM 2912 / NBRC 15312 / T2) TaxID=562970 RepID=D5WVI4_KYRT2|nr:hypothetical protein [Kyrpidia tusciae]ADG05594.1 plasmid pRiA4b ORF-3 family protein [Kyrpidia tusciae DSM 2912]